MQIVLWLVLFLILFSYAYASYIGAPWVPTKKHERARLLELVDIKTEQIVYDLGCGNGAVLFDFAKKFPDARYIGYDLSLLPLALAWLRPQKNVSIRFGNAYAQDISDADLVFIYLLDNNYGRLLKFLNAARLKPEATIIIEGWPLPGKEYYFSNREQGLLPLYFYNGTEFASAT